jgi:hypothetical protein
MLVVTCVLAGCSRWEDVSSIENGQVRVTALSKETSALTHFAVKIEVQNLFMGIALRSHTVIRVGDLNTCRLAFLDDATVAAKVHYRFHPGNAQDFLFRPGAVPRETIVLPYDYERPSDDRNPIEQLVATDSSEFFTLVADKLPEPRSTFRISLKRRDWFGARALYIMGADSVQVDLLSDEAFQIAVWWKDEAREVRYCGEIAPLIRGEVFFAVVCENPKDSITGQ